MEEKTAVKSNALQVLEKQLSGRARRNQHGIIVLSSATDPYLYFEKDELLTRKILELILHYRFPLHVITKSDLVSRDFDLLRLINENAILPADLQDKLTQKVFITFSFSSLDDKIASVFEPGAPVPSIRMETLKLALQHGFRGGVSLMPLLPFITDTGENLEFMFSKFARIGIHYIFPASLTLFGFGLADSRTLVYRSIERYYPHLMDKYHSWFSGKNFQMPSHYQEALLEKTASLSKKYGISNTLFDK
jgi:DNA repair photolyase